MTFSMSPTLLAAIDGLCQLNETKVVGVYIAIDGTMHILAQIQSPNDGQEDPALLYIKIPPATGSMELKDSSPLPLPSFRWEFTAMKSGIIHADQIKRELDFIWPDEEGVSFELFKASGMMRAYLNPLELPLVGSQTRRVVHVVKALLRTHLSLGLNSSFNCSGSF